jgi:hypothetical protein
MVGDAAQIVSERGESVAAATGKVGAKSEREMAWEKLMLRLLSLEPGIYSITLVVDQTNGLLLGAVDPRGQVEHFSRRPSS